MVSSTSRRGSVDLDRAPLVGRERLPNSRQVLESLYRAGPLTIAEVAAKTRLSRPTAAAAIEELEVLGWVESLAPATPIDRSAGRPARRVAFRSTTAIVAGIDIGVEHVKVVVADLDGTILLEEISDVPTPISGAGRVDAVITAAHSSIASIGPRMPLLAIGVGSPGPMDGYGVVRASPPIPEWEGLDLGARLSRPLGAPVILENDIMVAAVAENYFGVGRGSSNFVYLHAGRRISSAVIIGGRLHRGFNGAAGMVGEMPELRWHTAPERLLARFDDRLTTLEIFAAAANGDHVARDAVETYVDEVATGLSAVVLSVDPELVVVGGGTSLAGAEFSGLLRARLTARARLVNPPVQVSSLGERAVVLGAIRLALDHVEEHVLDLVRLA